MRLHPKKKPIPKTRSASVSPAPQAREPSILPGSEMATNIESLAEQFDLNLERLSSDQKDLALIIIQSITSFMDQKFEKERLESRATIEKLERKLITYEEKLDDMENYSRRNTLVISGPNVPVAATNEDSIAVAVDIIASKLEVPIGPEDICVAHRLGARKTGTPDKRNIIVKLVRRRKKHEIYSACAVKKPQGVFFTDSLSRTRHTIMYALRKARQKDSTKFGLIRTRDCNIRLQLPNPGNPQAPTIEIVNTRRKLEELLRTRLGIDSSEFDCRW